MLNKEAPSLALRDDSGRIEPVQLAAIPEWEQALKGTLFGDDLRRFHQKMRRANDPLGEARQQLEAVLKWKTGAPLPADIRRCRHERCRRFFLVRRKRPGRFFHSEKCGGNYRAAKCMRGKIRETRERDLKRLRNALKSFRGLLDWKERAARKARVSKNFVTYAVRFGDVKIPRVRSTA